MEFALRRVDHRVAIPFWDSTMDDLLPDAKDSIIWTNDFMGDITDEVEFGPFAGWTTIDNKPLRRNVGAHGETMNSTVRDEYLLSNDIDRVFGLTAAHNVSCDLSLNNTDFKNASCTSYRVNAREMEFLHGRLKMFKNYLQQVF